MGKRGSAYYLFILLFIVAFVTVVGVLYNPTVTGNVVLDPNTIPPVQNDYTIQHELAQQIVPSVNRRVFVVPHSGNEAAAQALVTPRHFFPNGFSADVSESVIPQLESLGSVSPVTIYIPAPVPSIPSGSATPGVVSIAVLDTGVNPELSIPCKDFTHGPQVVEHCTDSNGHGTQVVSAIHAALGDTVSLSVAQVCTADQCSVDDIAAAIANARSNKVQIIVMALQGESTPLLDDAIAQATQTGIIVLMSNN